VRKEIESSEERACAPLIRHGLGQGIDNIWPFVCACDAFGDDRLGPAGLAPFCQRCEINHLDLAIETVRNSPCFLSGLLPNRDLKAGWLAERGQFQNHATLTDFPRGPACVSRYRSHNSICAVLEDCRACTNISFR